MKKKLLLSIIFCTFCVQGFSYSINPGAASICIGATVTETCSAIGGTWSSGNAAVATVGLSSGVVTGIAPGTAAISYNAGKNASVVVVTVNACCLTGSLIINTGYDPVAMTASAGEAGDNGTAIPDPKWIVTAISPDAAARIAAYGSVAVAIGAKADIVDADISPTYPAGSWVANTTSSPSNWITAQNAHGYETAEDNTLDLSMTLTRPFNMCLDDSIRIDVMIANDNYIVSANIDGTTDLPEFGVQAAAGTDPNNHANHETFQHFVTGAGIALAPGGHELNIVVQNYNFPESTIYNPTGMNLYGTLYSITGNNSLVREDDATCGAGSCASDIHTTEAPTTVKVTGNLVCFPNPNNGSFRLRGAVQDPATTKEARIEVVDMLGKIVYQDVAVIENGGIDKTVAPGDNIANGVYLIRVINDHSSKVIRVSINR